MPERLTELIALLHININRQDLLLIALRHRSSANESGLKQSNERLEFLGDAVLSIITANYLYNRFPESPEGELTNLRSALVRRETLAKWATELDLGRFLILGKGEEKMGGRTNPRNLANLFEAVLAVIYLEHGLELTTGWLEPRLATELDYILSHQQHIDFKGQLQHQFQEKLGHLPVYDVISATGPEHQRLYVVEVRAGITSLGSGSGTSKQLAQQNAARAALELIALNPDILEPLLTLPLEGTNE